MKSPASLLVSLALLSAVTTTTASTATDTAIDCSRQTKCLTIYAPVCGSDGTTYSNQCVFENAVCLAAKAKPKPKTATTAPLTKLFDGACDLTPNPFCGLRCAKNYAPVCGTDNKTYSNDCMLQGAKCGNVTVSAAYTGECRVATAKPTTKPKPKPTPKPTPTKPTTCDDVCPFIFNPVCGSDGKTYSNQCLLDVEACKCATTNKNKNKKPLKKVHDGECVAATKPPVCHDRVCAEIYQPQCGSDGKTYSNHCTFGIAHCQNASLRIAYSGECATQASACAAMSCLEFTECKLDPLTGSGYCADVCSPQRCKKDQVCALKQVQCVTTPCPPVATCTKRVQ